MFILKIEKISFGERSHCFSFEINNSETLFLIGRNGAGKSSLLLVLSGLIPLNTGNLFLNGENISKENEINRIERGIRICLEDRQIFPNLTVKENLLLGGYTLSKIDKENKYDEIISAFSDLKTKEFSVSKTLSGGQQTQLNIARSLMGNTKLLLLDEPTLGLDPRNVNKIGSIVKEFKKKYNLTLLIADNNLKFIKRLGGKIIKIEDGKMLFAKNPESAIDKGFFNDFYP